MKRVGVILFAVLSVALAAEEPEIARNLLSCGGQSENNNGCLKVAIQDAIPKIAKGIPEWGIPALDPFFIDFQETEYGNGFIHAKLAIKNTNAYGTSRAQIMDVRSTPSEGRHRLEVDVAFPKILIEGEYKSEGRLNDFKIGGKGFFNVSMEGITTTWDITGRVENDIFVVEHFRMSPEVQKMKVYFDDLFNGNESINLAARNFINEYWPLFYRELLPTAANEWDKQMTEFTNQFFARISYAKYFA